MKVKLKVKKIHRWHKEFEWLSNNYLSPMVYSGETYPSLSHAFLASKTLDQKLRKQIKEVKVSELDHWFKIVGPPPRAWHATTMMKDLVEFKFGLFPSGLVKDALAPMKLLKLLVNTGDAELVYGNLHHDSYWGKCLCNKGECLELPAKNLLGNIIMQVREKINKKIGLFNKVQEWCFCGAEAENCVLYTENWMPHLKVFCGSTECATRVMELIQEVSSDGIVYPYPSKGQIEMVMPELPESKPVNEIVTPKIVEIAKIEDDEDCFDCDSNGYNAFGVWMGMGMSSPNRPTVAITPPARKYETLVIQGK